jgi:hypothetical protein
MSRYSKLTKRPERAREGLGLQCPKTEAVLWPSIGVKPFRKIHALDPGNSWYLFSGVLCEEKYDQVMKATVGLH